ncbi:MAG: succinate dehydrogenase iron-sulfur subunit [Deltaproteobacteria bacterium]|nr:succinate dehydrogenase iron-sulfur subunit [Deltaproteobacteria bacterium]
MELKFKIARFHPDHDQAPHWQEYQLTCQPGDRLLDCLNRIKWEQDGTLSFRLSCAHGVCGSCAMQLNGRAALACQTLAGQFAAEGEVTVEPLPHFRLLKDLVVDLEPFFTLVREIRPFLVNHDAPPEDERHQSPEEHQKLAQVISCILCGCCSGACPALDEDPDYIGPAPLVQAFRRIMDSRDQDQAARLAQLDRPTGAWGCKNYFECTRVCPKKIPVTKCINQMKREIEQQGGGPAEK